MFDNANDLTEISNIENLIRQCQSAEASLQESRKIYTTILQKSFAAIYVIQNGNFCSVNPKIADYTGYSIDELIGRKTDSIVHPEDKKDILHRARAMLHGESTTPYAYRIITKQGNIRWIIETVSGITYGGHPAILGNSMDITEHRQAIQKLQDSKNLYRTIFETTLAATIIIEEDTTVSLINSEFAEMSGYNREEWEGKKSWTEVVIPEDVERMKKYHYLRRQSREAAPLTYECGFIGRRGGIRNVILMVDVIPNTKKSVASFIDITEQKQAVTLLKESEDLYRTIFENTGTATLILEEDMTISLANTEFEALTGASEEFWRGNSQWTKLFKPRDIDKIIRYYQGRESHAGRGLVRNFQCEISDRLGNKKVVLISSAPIADSGKRVVSLTDITEQKRIEAALMAREQEVQKKSRNLEEMNAALKVLLNQRQEDRRELEEKVLANVNELILPNLTKLKAGRLAPRDLALLNIIESNIVEIVSPFSNRLQAQHLNLTQREMQIANFIREGKSTKEIAELLDICTGAVSFHRDNLRKKLGLNNKNINLKSHLDSLS